MTCKNCGNEFNGEFCNQCAQSARVGKFTSRNLLEELSENIFQINHGFFYTLKYLFIRPGHLIREYLRGQRKKYFKPITYVLVISTVYFILNKIFETDNIVEDFLTGFQTSFNENENDVKDLNFLKWFSNNFAYTILGLIPFFSLVHRKFHDPNIVQVSTLLSIKTGGCPEDCGYCPQAARYHTDIEGNDLMEVSHVKAQALRAKATGSSRLCMGAAWRNVKDGEDFEKVLDMVRAVNNLDMEVCCTLGMVTENQAKRLAEAGLYAYNHNLDSSEEYYKEVISTRGYQDRLDTIDNVRKSNVTVCSGGIIGMGESIEDRADMLIALSTLNPQPESTPINALVPVEGTPLEDQKPVEIWEMVRMIATTRIVMPQTQVRLSAGRTQMSKEGQAMCFFVGANSIFAGDKLLTTPNPDVNEDMALFKALGLKPQKAFVHGDKPISKPKEEAQHQPLGEKPKWSRPGHKIERNLAAKESAKAAKL